jgi:hypothetical protein
MILPPADLGTLAAALFLLGGLAGIVHGTRELRAVALPRRRRRKGNRVSRRQTLFAWKHLETGTIHQNIVASTLESLFDLSGFRAVRPERMAQPYRGGLAVAVQRDRDGNLIEVAESIAREPAR